MHILWYVYIITRLSKRVPCASFLICHTGRASSFVISNVAQRYVAQRCVGGDDNIAIKNDTANVLIENCVFGNGHGASIGSVPDTNGVMGYVTNVTFRNLVMNGNAACKIKVLGSSTCCTAATAAAVAGGGGGGAVSDNSVCTVYCVKPTICVEMLWGRPGLTLLARSRTFCTRTLCSTVARAAM